MPVTRVPERLHVITVVLKRDSDEAYFEDRYEEFVNDPRNVVHLPRVVLTATAGQAYTVLVAMIPYHLKADEDQEPA